jgi:16S rRNA (adenine1518-N6/adenine1519-N6)-dimethyltransferase
MVSIRTELKEHGLFPKKRLGQHFLADRNIIRKVIDAAQVGKDDLVLDVGPGLGEMTKILSARAKKVLAVEVDPSLAAILKQKMNAESNVEVIEEDILKLDFGRMSQAEKQKIKVVANLPYQISTPLLFRFIEARELFTDLTLMLQKEVAERLTARPGGKEYSPLSIFVQMFSHVSICFQVKPSAFFPPPKVESTVIRILWRDRPAAALKDEAWFRKVVKGVMGYRRKTLVNALKYAGLAFPGTPESRLQQAGIDPLRRPGTLTLQEFVTLAETLKDREQRSEVRDQKE